MTGPVSSVVAVRGDGLRLHFALVGNVGVVHEIACALLVRAVKALAAVEGKVADLAERRDYDLLLEALASTRSAVDAFFQNVMVLAEDPAVRRNRLALLNRFVSLFERFADFGALSS